MERLIARGLMFGNLIEIGTETLRARYNAGLEALTGKRTALEHFHIDLSGYSPEIGDEFGDHDYLNPNGCNRMFILLTTEQETRPLIGAKFSTSRSILRRFIADNRTELFALTARDAVIGELENSTYRIATLNDALSIRKIRAAVDTPRRLITSAIELQGRLDEFEDSPHAWMDDAKLNAIVGLAKQVGDIRRTPVVPARTDYVQGNFYTSHFGGVYAFRDVPYPAIVSCDPGFAPDGSIGIDHIALGDTATLHDFLRRNDLIEDVAVAADLDSRALLRQRLDFILVDHLAALEDGPDLVALHQSELQRMVHRFYDRLPGAFHRIALTLRALEQETDPPEIGGDDPAAFYLVRSAAHADRDLVNHLLARLTPLDIRQLFICNKDVFYATYRGWGERKRSYVAEFLARHYAPAKEETREALFGVAAARAENGAATRAENEAADAETAGEDGDGGAPQSGPWGPMPVEN